MTELLRFVSLASRTWRALSGRDRATLRELLTGLQDKKYESVRDVVLRELKYIVEERFQRVAFDERMKREIPKPPGGAH